MDQIAIDNKLVQLRSEHPEDYITLNDPLMAELVPHVTEAERIAEGQRLFQTEVPIHTSVKREAA